MGRNQRTKKVWKLKYKIRLLNLALVVAIIFNIFIFALIPLIMGRSDVLQSFDIMLLGLMVSAICIVTVFILLLVIILHRSLGPIMQVEKVLAQVIDGDYSVRVHFRKDDLLHEMENKLNAVLEILENEAHKSR